jgi:hypothetical protein
MVEFPTVLLGSDKVREGLERGLFYRDGGVIRETATGRIVEILRDGQLPHPKMAEILSASVVPLAVQAVGFAIVVAKLESIRTSLESLSEQVRGLRDDLRAIAARLDARSIGRLIGAIHSCSLELKEGFTARFAEYRQCFLEYYHEFRQLAELVSGDRDLFRSHPELLLRSHQAMCLSGVAARDLCVRMGQRESALELGEWIHRDSSEIEARVAKLVDSPSSLFWIEREHRQVRAEIRESTARLRGHIEQLRLAWDSPVGAQVRALLGIPPVSAEK